MAAGRRRGLAARSPGCGLIVVHERAAHRGPRSEPRPGRIWEEIFRLPEGWDAPMNDDAVGEFLNERISFRYLCLAARLARVSDAWR